MHYTRSITGVTTPVTSGPFASPASTAVVIPSVGHLAGLGSQWQSDIRIANITALAKKVQLMFNTGSAGSTGIKTTTLMVYPYDATVVPDATKIDAVYQTAYKAMPNVKLVRIDDSRHFVMYDQPEKLDVQLQAFLK